MSKSFENCIKKEGEADNRDINSVVSRIKDVENAKEDLSVQEKNTETSEKLRKYIAEIQEIAEKYEVLDLINPSGRIEGENRLTYKDEIKIFKKEIENSPDYNPVFTYPEIEKLDEKELELKIRELEQIGERVNAEEENMYIKEIVFECIEKSVAEMNFIKAVKNKNDAKAYQYSVEAYDDIDKDLIENSKAYYESKFFDKDYIYNPLRNKLKEIKLSAQDLKEIFQIALDVLGSSDFKINLKDNVENISISDTRQEIKIPEKNKYTGERVVELVSHEICTHAISMMNSGKAGYPGISIGKNVTTFSEGISMLSEERTGKHIFGDVKPIDKDWFIHAMAFRKEGNGFGATYLEMKKRILGQLLVQCVGKEKAEENAEKEALNICRRIFRGMHDLSADSKYYYTKDACYFKGYIESQKIAKEGLDHYLTDMRVDPYLIPYFLSLKAIPEKALHTNRKVIEAMWDKKGFSRDFIENYEWYKENTQMDRHMAYRREFGQIDGEVEGLRKGMENGKFK